MDMNPAVNLECAPAPKSISIIGTVGVPGSYGGFETLAENLVRYHCAMDAGGKLSVYCSSRASEGKRDSFLGAELRYVPLEPNGVQSILYDIWSLVESVRRKDNFLLVLGVSGAMFFPVLRAISRARIITNIDGIEWRREKWRGLARRFLRWSERAAVRWSDVVITDNQGISEYVKHTYNVDSVLIPYGGDHALAAEPDESAVQVLPKNFALALCRIEPENNVAMILEAFAEIDTPLVFVGNWDKSDYGLDLAARYKDHKSITIHDPVYEPSALRAIRDRASLYVHGHSAGGTNPSLVEMMHFSIPVLAHGCSFNRHTTEEKARYFMNSAELGDAVRALSPQIASQIGAQMGEIARRRYTWDQIGRAYFELLES